MLKNLQAAEALLALQYLGHAAPRPVKKASGVRCVYELHGMPRPTASNGFNRLSNRSSNRSSYTAKKRRGKAATRSTATSKKKKKKTVSKRAK